MTSTVPDARATPSTGTRLRHLARRIAGVRRPDLWLARRLGRLLDDRRYLAFGHLFYFGRWPDYDHPRTVNEHIQAYMLRCRDPLLQEVADKAAMRDIVAERVGTQYLVPLVGVWDDAAAVPWATLPRPCVVKTTVGSGQVWFLRPGASVDFDDLRCSLERWLHTDFSRLSREWCYRGLRNRIIVEAMLGDGTTLPADYKLYVIGGQVRFIQVDRGRFGRHTRNLYSPDWRLLEERLSLQNHEPDPRPACLAEMLDVTHRLAEPFEFLRVDCYVVDGRLYVGELTNYPGAGFERFIPHRYALELGALWTSGTRTPAGGVVAEGASRAHAGRS